MTLTRPINIHSYSSYKTVWMFCQSSHLLIVISSDNSICTTVHYRETNLCGFSMNNKEWSFESAICINYQNNLEKQCFIKWIAILQVNRIWTRLIGFISSATNRTGIKCCLTLQLKRHFICRPYNVLLTSFKMSL